jgi:hypothetical protein
VSPEPGEVGERFAHPRSEDGDPDRAELVGDPLRDEHIVAQVRRRCQHRLGMCTDGL